MSVKFQDYYETLGVQRNATADEIQKAYRALARKYHPDVSKEVNAESKFKEASEAYEVLKDPDSRKQYDRLGANWKAGQDFRPPPGWENVQFRTGGDFGGGGADFSDFFSTLFGGGGMGGFGSGGRQRVHPLRQRGEDYEVEIEVALEEVAKGAKKPVEFDAPEIGERKSLSVTIPAGVVDGSKIRLPGQGGPGIAGGPAGDLFLRVRFRRDARFSPDGHNLRMSLKIAPWEAALGTDVQIPTLDGDVKMKVPAGVQSGQVLRLREKGLVNRKGNPGDLLATVQIVVPKKLTEKEKELFEELSKESDFEPRG